MSSSKPPAAKPPAGKPLVVLIYNKSNTFGLAKDVQFFKNALPDCNIVVRDPLEPPVPCDIAIHLEVPVYVYMPWASINCLLVNPEWYSEEWDGYSEHIDYYFVRDKESESRFQEKFPKASCVHVPWCLPKPEKVNLTAYPSSTDHEDGFAWFVGGSKNKRSAVQWLAPHWKAEYPPLFVFSAEAIDLSGVTLSNNVKFKVGYTSDDAKEKLSTFFPGQICISEAESFGYATAEAEQSGAFLLMNTLDTYVEHYTDKSHTAWITTPLIKNKNGMANIADFTSVSGLEAQLDKAIQEFRITDIELCRKFQKESEKRKRVTCFVDWKKSNMWLTLCTKALALTKDKPLLPPVLLPEDCPKISIVTLLYNRRKFFELACHNILLSDYPKEKIEWILVDDSDDPNEGVSDRVVQVGENSAPLQLVYVPIKKKTPIYKKRNIGVHTATNDIILFMDDDDSYPSTSFRRRVAWLTQHAWKPKCVSCTTIACYDLLRGVSAVNTPPFSLGFSKRVSEATMAFYKTFWEERNFLESVLSEGEGFLFERENQCIELPPQQIIVAFSHKTNTSGRRIPSEDAKPGCFWGFPKEYLKYIHGLVDVQIEDE